MDRNPYAPPTAPVADVVTTAAGTLYSPRQIYMASFLGSPIAAAWFIRHNFLTLGNKSALLRTLWLGLAATIAVVVTGYFLPKQFPNALLPLLYSYAIYLYAQFLFKTPYNKHLTAGGRRGSWWIVIGISLFAAMILVGVAFAIAFAMPSLLAGR